MLEAEKHSFSVHRHFGIEVLLRSINQPSHRFSPGVVDSAIEAAVGLDRRLHKCCDLLVARDIGAHEPSLAANGLDQPECLLALRFAAASDAHAGTRPTKFDR